LTDGTELLVDNPTELPDLSRLDHIDEPMLAITILTPSEYLGAVMDLAQSRRGEMIKMDYMSTDRVELRYTIPLAEVVIDFFDALKSRTKGYASSTTNRVLHHVTTRPRRPLDQSRAG